jgi:N-formylglutamate amidohydrolase
MIFHIPHSSFSIPSDLRSTIALDDRALEDELRAMTDAYTDDLFGCHAEADDALIIFPVSRLVVDPERFLDEMLEMMAWIGMGVVYTQTSGGATLRDNPTLEERDYLIRTFYVPHHDLLNEATGSALRQNGAVLVLDCHSFPSAPLPYELDQDGDRPDICIGTHPFHTPPDLIEIGRGAVAAEGLTCRLNKPFDGCLVPNRFLEQDERVSSIMIEVNRSLYMDESSGERSSQYDQCRGAVGRIIQRIRQVDAPPHGRI